MEQTASSTQPTRTLHQRPMLDLQRAHRLDSSTPHSKVVQHRPLHTHITRRHGRAQQPPHSALRLQLQPGQLDTWRLPHVTPVVTVGNYEATLKGGGLPVKQDYRCTAGVATVLSPRDFWNVGHR